MSTLDKIRSWRIGPLAAFDFLGTIWIGLVWSDYTGMDPTESVIGWLVGATAVHKLLSVSTPLTDMVFG